MRLSSVSLRLGDLGYASREGEDDAERARDHSGSPPPAKAMMSGLSHVVAQHLASAAHEPHLRSGEH
jgi:hypothetical protein